MKWVIFMNIWNNIKLFASNFSFIFGVRPDIAIIFIILCIIALIICILIAKKNHLFNFSKNESLKKVKDCEFLQ